MKVKLLTDGGFDTPGIVGKIVEATPFRSRNTDLFDVQVTELYRVDPEGWKYEYETTPDYKFCFLNHEVEVLD